MKNTLLFSIGILLATQCCVAQQQRIFKTTGEEEIQQTQMQVLNTLNGKTENVDTPEAFDNDEINTLITKQMQSLLGGQESSTIGTFAGLSIDDPSVTFTPSIVLKSGQIITSEFKGGITDGVAAIFTNNRLNTNIQVGFQYHTQNPWTESIISLNGDQVIDYKEKLLKIQINLDNSLDFIDNYKLNALKDKLYTLQEATVKIQNQLNQLDEIDNEIDIIDLEIQVNNNTIKSKNAEIAKLENTPKDQEKKIALQLAIKQLEAVNKAKAQTKKTKEALKGTKEILENKIASSQRDVRLQNEAIVNFQKNKNTEKLRLIQAANKTKKELKKAFKPEISRLKLNWFSLGYKVRRDNFNLFEGDAAFADQFVNETTERHEISMQYSAYNYNKIEQWTSYFNALGLRFLYTNTLNELSGVEVVDTQSIPNDEVSRTITSTTTAYVGDFDEHIRGISFYDDFYYFVLNKNKGAIHLAPEYVIREGQKPKSNVTLGFLFSFKNSDADETTPVNAELFYTLVDVFDNFDSEFKTLERNAIGLRFVFPINFSL